VLFKELPPVLVTAQPHPLDLVGLEGVHGNASNKRYVYAQPAVNAGAREADEDAKLGRRPLRRWCVAVTADVVSRLLLKGRQLL
jgi:hypothetical protein